MTDLSSMNPIESHPTPGEVNGRVVVAMSGGVDSSVAAALLVDQGYDVIGIMMRLWSESSTYLPKKGNRCCTPGQMADAREVARRLNIPFFVLDVQDFFHRSVVQPFIQGHASGRTPNPCIACNRNVRFDYLLEYALSLGASYLATGHYARIRKTDGCFQLLRACDESKDQSYVLYILGQEQLANILFPVGTLAKEEVRDIARDFKIPVASKKESMDLCFVADGDYRRFLRVEAADSFRPGSIIDLSGNIVGQHSGLPDYTIGQRKGLGIAAGRPLYVLTKRVDANQLIVGTQSDLGRTSLIAERVNWVSGKPPAKAIDAHVKIRYRATPIKGLISRLDDERVSVEFEEPVNGITSGQGAVFYDGEACLGGGIISGELPPW